MTTDQDEIDAKESGVIDKQKQIRKISSLRNDEITPERKFKRVKFPRYFDRKDFNMQLEAEA